MDGGGKHYEYPDQYIYMFMGSNLHSFGKCCEIKF